MAMMKYDDINTGSATTKSAASTSTSQNDVVNKAMANNNAIQQQRAQQIQQAQSKSSGGGRGSSINVGQAVSEVMDNGYSEKMQEIYDQIMARLNENKDSLLSQTDRNKQLADNATNAYWNKYKKAWNNAYNPNMNRGSGISNYLSGASDVQNMYAQNARDRDDANREINKAINDNEVDVMSRYLQYLSNL
ncbi:MAG: hypothetical protein KBT35_01190 [Firmicutes bacterium]|nr:hypothetical protein [Candidatus Colivicinus equi]